MRFDKIDQLIRDIITKANGDTGKLNKLLEFIDYFCSAQNTFGEEIIDQYGPKVKLFEIRDGMDIAIQKLKQYQNVILSATNISRRYNSMMFTKEI